MKLYLPKNSSAKAGIGGDDRSLAAMPQVQTIQMIAYYPKRTETQVQHENEQAGSLVGGQAVRFKLPLFTYQPPQHS